MRIKTARTLFWLFPLVALVIATGCKGGGGHGGSSGPSPAPVISNLQLTALDPEVVNRDIRYVVAFQFTDLQGDVINGDCEVLLNNVSLGRATIQPVSGTDVNLASGAVACGFVVRAFIPQQVNGRARIFDRAGNQSNELTFVLGIRAAEVPKGHIPQQEVPKGSLDGRMESGTVRQ